MKKIISAGLALIGALTVINSAEARQTPKENVNSKSHEQTMRIHQGVKTAAPTAIEAGKPVAKTVTKIAKSETNVRKAGALKGAKIEKKNSVSKEIVRQK